MPVPRPIPRAAPAILLLAALGAAGCASGPQPVGKTEPVRYDLRLLSDETAVAVVLQGIRFTPSWQVVGTEGATVQAKCGQAKWPDALREEHERKAQPPGSPPCVDGVAITCADGKITFACTDGHGKKTEAAGMAASPVYERELKTLRARIIQALGPSFMPSDAAPTP